MDKKSLIEEEIARGQKVFGFEDVAYYRGHELSTEDIASRKASEEKKLQMLRTIALSIRKLKAEGDIDGVDYKIFACHFGLTRDGKELKLSAIARVLNLEIEEVMDRYSKTINLLKAEVLNFNSESVEVDN